MKLIYSSDDLDMVTYLNNQLIRYKANKSWLMKTNNKWIDCPVKSFAQEEMIKDFNGNLDAILNREDPRVDAVWEAVNANKAFMRAFARKQFKY